jgi:hypothetical protein
MKYPSSAPSLPSGGSVNALPNANNAITGWEVAIKLIKITTSNNGGKIKQNITTIPTIAIVQPLSPQELEIKPEGERSFEWLQVHIRIENFTLNITTGDKIEWQGKKYTIMNDLGYELYGHKQFHVCNLINKNAN